ncbi:GLE1-domain-containing protein [Hypoxylon sp. NC1633]|nr:GLE1-domain-containing protein [Hypoxylon sp. NC1633]
MTDSSPAARRSQQWLSSDRPRRISNLLAEDRNSELSHQDALTAAQAEHSRVREAAIRVFHDYELQEERNRLLEQQAKVLEQQKKEEERIRSEERLRAEEERLRALKAKTVPKLSPVQPAPVAQANGSSTSQETTQSTQSTKSTPIVNGFQQQSGSTKSPFGAVNGANGLKPQPSPFSSISHPQPQAQEQIQTATAPVTQLPTPAPSQSGKSADSSLAKLSIGDGNDRYVEIHKNLKKLRASLDQQCKASPPLKKRMGDMRRELRKNMGQLVGEKGGNKKQIAAIQVLLDEALSGAVPSQLIDASDFVTDKREPVQGARYNQPQLPSLFIYLLNHFAKTVINQFINECEAQPKNADPIGVVVAMIFSKDLYLWRGKTLIDILMAKFRVVCPVLFGYRGNEKTDQGRVRVGWKKGPGGWISEQTHGDRMKGLGAGFAAIALRNFANSKNTNPWPPSKYWTAMAQIVNTPPAEISDTQCMVLRAIIEGSEEKFVQFYGNAAVAALRKALIEIPSKAEIATPGVKGLEVLGAVLQRNIGLQL